MKLATFRLSAIISLLLLVLLSSFVTWFVTSQFYKNYPNKQPTLVTRTPSNWMGIYKNHENLNENMEGTPFVWKDNLYYFVSEREIIPELYQFSIYDFNSRQRVTVFAVGEQLALGSVFVEDDVLYAFGTKNHGKYGESEIYMVASIDLKSFSKPVSIYKATSNESIFNTSVTKNIYTGDYIMAIETSTQGELKPFSIYFLKSKDLTRWILLSDFEGKVYPFGYDIYVASPTIKFFNRYYYLWFLTREYNDPNCPQCETYVTKIARSRNLIEWQTSPHYFLVPDMHDEGINTSDVDLTEFHEKIYILFAIGDQAKWKKMRYAVFNGSMKVLVNQYFNTSSRN